MAIVFKKKFPFFERFPGGYFAICGAIFFLIMFGISIALHSITDPVSWTRHFVSNMGIGLNGGGLAFSIGILGLSILLYPFIINLGQQLWMDETKEPRHPKAHLNNLFLNVAFILAMVAIPGLMMIAFFSMAPATIVPHAIGASFFFLGTLLYGALFWNSLELNKKSSWLLRICSIMVLGFFICFICSTIVLVIQFPEESQLFMSNPTNYVVRILGDVTDTKLAYIRVFEWLFVLAMIVWCLSLGVLSVKLMENKKHK